MHTIRIVLILTLFSCEFAFEFMAMDWQRWKRTRWSHARLCELLPPMHRLWLAHFLSEFFPDPPCLVFGYYQSCHDCGNLEWERSPSGLHLRADPPLPSLQSWKQGLRWSFKHLRTSVGLARHWCVVQELTVRIYPNETLQDFAIRSANDWWQPCYY